MPDVEVTVTTTPIDVYINSDPTVYIDTATQGVQGPSAPTGDFISRSETGLFYPASNPSGFVPSDQPIFEARPQVEQIGGALLGLAYVTEVGDKLPIANDFAQVVKWNGYEWVAQRVDASEIDNLNIPPDRVPAYSNNGDALFWYAPVEPTEGSWIGRKITTGDISGLSLFSGDFFKIGGDSRGQPLSLGTNDAYDLDFETSGTTRMSISKNGIITVGGTGSQRIYFDTTVAGSPQIRWSGAIPNQGSRLTSKDGGGSWVTLDRVDGSAENLNIVGNLQVGTGVGIRSQKLYVHGNALITQDLTVNTSGNFVSGLFVNRRPVLTGVLNSGSGIRLASGTRNNDLILKNISGKNNITVSETGNLINVQLNDVIYAANQLAEINLPNREITNFDFRSAVLNILPLGNQVYLSDFNLAEEGQEFVPFNFVPGQAFDLTPSGKNGVISLYKETGLISGFIIDSPQILINGTDILDLVSFSGEISNLESMISGLSGYSESTYATKTEVAALSGIVTGNNYSLTEMINSLSGYADLNFATIFNLNQTGEFLLNQVNSLSGTVTGTYATKQYVVDSINTLSGNLTFVNYKYTLTAGYDEYEITFPQPFIQPPRTVMVQMENEQYNIIYAYDVYGITSSGFSVKFSDILAEENKLMVLAKA